MKILVKKGDHGYQYQFLFYDNIDQAIYYTINQPDIVTLCDNCEHNISGHIKIITSQGDYCVSCFAQLRSFPHEYRVMNHLDIVLFDYKWSAEEECLLLEGIDQFGYDWEDIAFYMQLDKTPEEVRQHYQNHYLSQPDLVPPLLISTNGQIIKIQHSHADIDGQGSLESNYYEEPTICKVEEQLTRLPQRLVKRRRNRRRKAHLSSYNKVKPASVRKIEYDKNGYMIKRGEFEEEFDNDAELLLTELEVAEDEPVSTYWLKQQIVTFYNERVAKRNMIKDFIINRKIIDLEYCIRRNKERIPLENQLNGMMKVFSRFITQRQYDQLIAGTARSLEISRRIDQLKTMQRKGYKTLQQVEEALQRSTSTNLKIQKQKQPCSKLSSVTSKISRKKLDRSYDRGNQLNPLWGSETQQFCDSIGISIETYLLIRSELLMSSLRNKHFNLKNSGIFKIDQAVVAKVYRYLKRSLEFQDIIASTTSKE